MGDARLAVLPAGEERLVSFALDQKTMVDRETKDRTGLVKAKISSGTLVLTVLKERDTGYRIKAPAREGRLIVIEHPRRQSGRWPARPKSTRS